MGGTGVLKFSGHYNLQLVVSRRNPKIIGRGTTNTNENDWGFTIVRREDPSGNRRSSVYTYLAPNKDSDGLGNVLSFPSESMPIFPDGREPYKKESQWGKDPILPAAECFEAKEGGQR